jgi:hypothetical protein
MMSTRSIRPDWGDPGPVDAFKGLLACQDDNSYYAAVKGFAQYVSDVQQNFEDICTEALGSVPLRVQNLTQSTADMYNTTGCFGAEAGPQCVQDNLAGKPLNPNLTQFQIYCLNNCADPDTVQSGGWQQAGDAVRQLFKDLWDKFIEAYPPPSM